MPTLFCYIWLHQGILLESLKDSKQSRGLVWTKRESVEALIVGSFPTQTPDGQAYDSLRSGGSFITVFAGLWSPGRNDSHSIVLRRLLTGLIQMFSIYSSDPLYQLFTGSAPSMTELRRASSLAPEEGRLSTS
ncbi:hypothetical protein DY000_02031958 [Brassica cretica]|uniref:Uncharacterized protein n=1 Tax=Brassica cretica TaxID=69181 RepID=A0ABQ7DNM5_BRACR|nr:hypothetical protein DY000_02031958 [Brassica cretica]